MAVLCGKSCLALKLDTLRWQKKQNSHTYTQSANESCHKGKWAPSRSVNDRERWSICACLYLSFFSLQWVKAWCSPPCQTVVWLKEQVSLRQGCLCAKISISVFIKCILHCCQQQELRLIWKNIIYTLLCPVCSCLRQSQTGLDYFKTHETWNTLVVYSVMIAKIP